MEELRLGDQMIRYDREATAAAYKLLPHGSAERCNCACCRNFAAQRATVYPKKFLSLLAQLGIDPDKEGEVYDMIGPFEDRIRPTGGWFYFVGELVEQGWSSLSDGDFKYWLQPSFPRPPACFGEHVAAIEFSTSVPWVLKEGPY
jgi:hypothetical protein